MTAASPIATLLAALPAPALPAPPGDLPGAFLDFLSELDTPEMAPAVDDPSPAPQTQDETNERELLAAAWAVLPPASVTLTDPQPITVASPQLASTPGVQEAVPPSLTLVKEVETPPADIPTAVTPPQPQIEPSPDRPLPKAVEPENQAPWPPQSGLPVEDTHQGRPPEVVTAPEPAPLFQSPVQSPSAPPQDALKTKEVTARETLASPAPSPTPVSDARPEEIAVNSDPEPAPSVQAAIATDRPLAPPPRASLAFAARLRSTPPRVGAGLTPEVLEKPTAERQDSERRSSPEPAPPNEPKRPAADSPRASRPTDDAPPVAREASDRRIHFFNTPHPEEPPAAETDEMSPPATPPAQKTTLRRETPLAPPVVRDIRLEVAGPDHRIEVRLVEKSGEVHFAVRTPDSRLAEGLRAELPQLSARLEEAGFQAEEWRVASAAGTERRLDIPGAASSSADTRQHGQPGGGDGQERREQQDPPRQPDTSRRGTQKGNEFAWLMQSLR